MTTIVTDGTTVAADSLCCYGNEIAALGRPKIVTRTSRDGKTRVFAFAGAASMREAVCEWYENGAVPKDVPHASGENAWSMLVFEVGRTVNLFSTCPYPLEFLPPFGIGTGAEFALGAVHHGATAAEAVAVAIKLDRNSGGEIQVVDLAEALGVKRGKRTAMAAEKARALV